jgi:hypothetical protein
MKIYCDICNSILTWENTSTWVDSSKDHHIWRYEKVAECQYHGIRDREFINNSDERYNGGGGMCFIATAAYGTELDPRLDILRSFRDQVLLPNSLGKRFVDFYYRYSPPIADLIRPHKSLRVIIRIVLKPIIAIVARKIK